MRTFESEEFTSFHDRGGHVYEDLHFKKCTFVSSAVSITEEPTDRTTVRDVTLERCRVVGSALHCAVVEDVPGCGLGARHQPGGGGGARAGRQGADDIVLVAHRRSRNSKQLLAGIRELRAAGVAEPD